MPITYDHRQPWALLTAPYRASEAPRPHEIEYASEQDLRDAGWRPADEVGLMSTMIARQMLEQLMTVLGCEQTADTWEDALDRVRALRGRQP
jgi:hypothetical protein